MKRVKKSKNSVEALSLKNEIIGIFLLFLSIFIILSVVSYTPDDPSFFHSKADFSVLNYGGRIGAEIAALFYNLFGYASIIIVFAVLFFTCYFFSNRIIENIISKSIGFFLLLIALSAFIANIKPQAVISGQTVLAGGFIGDLLNSLVSGAVKGFFALLIFTCLISVSLILVAKVSLKKTGKIMGVWFSKLTALLRDYVSILFERHRKDKRLKKVQKKHGESSSWTLGVSKKSSKAIEKKKKTVRQPSRLPEEKLLFADMQNEVKGEAKYSPPPVTFLDASTEKSQIDYKELGQKREELSQQLNDFRIKGDIVEFTPGPVITTYEFVPDVGVKVKDVRGLEEDLALVVKAQYVRIERILGKKAIGIEIPNKKREIIHLRELIESEEFRQYQSPLTIALGKTKSGEIFVSDLREMPHLIIAGATGSGKSVAIHAVILSILYRSSPEDVKFVLIDPKRVELAIYNALPHLLTPVVTDEKLAKNALDWSVFEMEERYKKLASLQVRNLDQYNKRLELLKQSREELPEHIAGLEKLPYVVIIIDELAELMMMASKEIESNIARIAQKARAVGIHLILATQRPSIDVITGTIKNNFPSRIALAVPSKHDSRTIIDVGGAEKLLGLGDMLFLPPKTASLIRLHCSYVSEDEALRVVNFLSKQGKPQFNTEVVKTHAKKEGQVDDKEMDDLFFEAAEVTISTGQASASFLQRKMSIGYARAGRLIDQLQTAGVVSASDRKNQRDILMTLEELDQLRYPGDTQNDVPSH